MNLRNRGGFYHLTYELAEVLENKIKKSPKDDFIILAVPMGIEPMLPE